ncbi:MAG: hypothetical protein EAZ21_13120 [Betaproteobacteria bacterium]|nr:MAG: hypothetical protein EAZ21_13120 [Betaproteobacteria bacterium]
MNSAQRYGAFLADNVTSVTITNTRVFSNTATDSGITTENAGRFGGFAVFNVTGDVNISGGSVVGNFAERERAGLQVSNVTGNVTISGLDVIGNTANQERGGMSIFTVAGNVSLSDLTIAGNIAPNGRVGGLEISTDTFATNGNCNFAQLRPASLTNVVVRGNFAATNTGGLRIFCSGAVAMSGMSIESNEVSGSTVASVGGGLGAGQLFNNTSVTLTNSTISGNKTYSNPIDQSGGFGNLGLYGNGSVVISGVTVKGNWVEQNEAGITVFAQSGTSPAGTVSIENSAFYDNRAKGLMGLWINGAGTYSIKNTTFAGNSSTATGGTVVGLNAHTGSSAPINVSLENVTIARNGPNDNPFTDGAFAPSPTVPVPNLNLTIKNSILGQYQAVNGPGAFLNGTSGYNYTIQNSLFENTNLPSGVCGTNGVICGVDAKLESLNHNGGNTMTLALRPGSAALDSGAVTTLTTDQRGAGFPRVVGAAVDMGAFESPALTAATPCKLDMDGDNQVTATKEGLVLLRAMLGFSEANAVPGTGISQSQWNTTRVNLNANCGTIFAP